MLRQPKKIPNDFQSLGKFKTGFEKSDELFFNPWGKNLKPVLKSRGLVSIIREFIQNLKSSKWLQKAKEKEAKNRETIFSIFLKQIGIKGQSSNFLFV